MELVDGQPHAEPKLGVVLKEGVGPGRAAPIGADRIRRCRQVAPVDGGAARRVGDECPVAEELCEQLDVGRLAAAGARTGELKERGHQLAAFDACQVHRLRVGVRYGQEVGEIRRFALANRNLRGHIDGAPSGFFLGFRMLFTGRAHLDAYATAGTVFGRHLDGEFLAREILPLRIDGLESLGSAVEVFRVVDFRPDGGVRTDKRTASALNTERRVPLRDIQGNVALLVAGRTGGPGAVVGHGADRK